MKHKKLCLSVAAATALCALEAAAALTWLGLASEKAQLQNTWQMNNICLNTYGIAGSRWASTADYEELMGTGNATVKRESEDFALRATDTIFTSDNRAFDQRTGTLSPADKYDYLGAVIVKPKGMTVFAGRKKKARPLCISGDTLYDTNPRLR
jgi:hypothetical protein